MPSNGTATGSAKSRSGKKHENEANPDMGLPGIGNYVYERTIGQGNFAKVKLAKHKLTGQEVAVKIIDKTTLDEKKLGKIHREVRIMKMLNHPNIVKLYEVIETKHTLFLVMEYVSGGELYDYLVAHGRMKEKDAKIKFRQILSAVNYCHRKRVIHRDLKAENLLLDSNLNIKIADFGFSNHYVPDGQLDTFCGSPPYAAPELFQGRKYTGPEVDIWSLGVILYVLCTGCLPFDGKDLKEMREVVCRGRYKVPFYLTDTCEKLLRKFLVRDPTKRASLDILIDDPWINEGFTDSPISAVLPPDPLQAVDEEIIRFVNDKFNVPREHVLNCLKENNYDDIAAIYMLLLDQKQSGKWQPYQPISPMSPVQLQQGTVSPVSRPTPMGTIGEEGEAANNADFSSSLNRDFVAGQVANAPNRDRAHTVGVNTNNSKQRPVTWVGNDSQVQKLMVEMNKQNLQGGPVGRNDNVNNLNNSPQISNAPLDNAANQYGSRSQKPAAGHVRHMTAPSTPASNQQNEAQPMQIDDAKDQNGQMGGTMKKNTVIGAIRSLGRRLSESASGYAAQQASAAAQAQMQQGQDQQVPGDEKPRSLRFTFNSNTTSTKPPDEIVREIVNACNKAHVRYAFTGKFVVECTWFYKDIPSKDQSGGGNMDTEQLQRALAEVMSGSNDKLNKDGSRSYVDGPKDAVRFDIEVCELPRLKNLHGLKFRRISGPSQEYKEICGKILATLNL